MALLALTSTGLVLTATWGGTTYAWDSVVIISLILGTVVAAVALMLVERRADEPVMPPHLFRDRNFVLTTADGLIIGVSMFGALAYLPTYLQMVAGAGAPEAGLLMIPMMAGLLACGRGDRRAEQWADRSYLYRKLALLQVCTHAMTGGPAATRSRPVRFAV